MSDIWQACAGRLRPGTLSGTLWRMVESQEEIATNALVDTLEEQAALEYLLDATKPRRSGLDDLHYLLATPFRYPPLRHGSRFGRTPRTAPASGASSPVWAGAARRAERRRWPWSRPRAS